MCRWHLCAVQSDLPFCWHSPSKQWCSRCFRRHAHSLQVANCCADCKMVCCHGRMHTQFTCQSCNVVPHLQILYVCCIYLDTQSHLSLLSLHKMPLLSTCTAWYGTIAVHAHPTLHSAMHLQPSFWRQEQQELLPACQLEAEAVPGNNSGGSGKLAVHCAADDQHGAR